MNRRRRIAFSSLLLLAVLLGVPILLTWRAVRQERLDRALIAAVKEKKANSVVSLLKQGADANTRDEQPDTRSFWHRLLDLWRGRRAQPSTLPTALLMALGDLEDSHYIPDPMLIKALLEAGADPNGQDTEHFTPLMIAAKNNDLSVDILGLLLDKGGNINDKDGDGFSALLIAVLSGYQDKVRLLLERGADFTVKAMHGNTVLMWLIIRPPGSAWAHWTQGGVWQNIDLLLDKGANINALNDYGRTALMLAAEGEQAETVKILLARHADVTLKDHYSMTALAFAHDNSQIIRLLKQAGAKE